MTFEHELEQKHHRAEEILKRYGVFKDVSYQKTVMEAMEYSLFAGGKRLRPILLSETFQMFHGQGNVDEPFMAAMEMIHTYSLVHDDLPAMDNDEYRRGKKTTHAVYGEDMAILTGDALLNRAFETAGLAFDMAEDASLRNVTRAMQILSEKAGIYGMVGGQVFDVEAENKAVPLTEEQLLFIYRLKTSALIEASLMIGATLAGAKEESVSLLETVGRNVGIAFQIRDDILDVTSTQEVLGKPIGSDERNHKTTFVTLKGLAGAEADVKAYTAKAQEALANLPCESAFLKRLIDSLTDRIK